MRCISSEQNRNSGPEKILGRRFPKREQDDYTEQENKNT